MRLHPCEQHLIDLTIASSLLLKFGHIQFSHLDFLTNVIEGVPNLQHVISKGLELIAILELDRLAEELFVFIFPMGTIHEHRDCNGSEQVHNCEEDEDLLQTSRGLFQCRRFLEAKKVKNSFPHFFFKESGDWTD